MGDPLRFLSSTSSWTCVWFASFHPNPLGKRTILLLFLDQESCYPQSLVRRHSKEQSPAHTTMAEKRRERPMHFFAQVWGCRMPWSLLLQVVRPCHKISRLPYFHGQKYQLWTHSFPSTSLFMVFGRWIQILCNYWTQVLETTWVDKVKSPKGTIRIMLNKVEEAQVHRKPCFIKAVNYSCNRLPRPQGWLASGPSLSTLGASACRVTVTSCRALDERRRLCWARRRVAGLTVVWLASWPWRPSMVRRGAHVINHVLGQVRASVTGSTFFLNEPF